VRVSIGPFIACPIVEDVADNVRIRTKVPRHGASPRCKLKRVKRRRLRSARLLHCILLSAR